MTQLMERPVPVQSPPIEGNTEPGLLVETRGLTRVYGQRKAVDAVDLRIRRGEVYGFLGPNGAGKTTTIRMLLGLVRPTSGSAVVVGERPGSEAGLRRIGSMIEQPGFYPFLSGRANLRYLARLADVPADRVDAVLDEVGLTNRGDDAFGQYSMGMKQRLGLASALLKDPELLILDEPSNGLDPAGMAEMRVLIRALGQGARTVMLSSHLLSEVEQICDRVGVIREGQLIAEGTVAELRGRDKLHLQVDSPDQAHAILTNLGGIESIDHVDGELVLNVDHEQTAAINRSLVTAGVDVSALYWKRAALEDVFLELTHGSEEL